MELNLERPLLFFDIESTGLNIATDAIAELSFVKVFPGGEQRIKTWRVKPWNYATGTQLPMNPSASAVNGIKVSPTPLHPSRGFTPTAPCPGALSLRSDG